MGKKSLERQLPDNEVRAKGGSIRTSARKLNAVAQSIRGKTVARALAELAYSPRRIANDVRKVLQSAVANAENNHGLDVDRLIVAHASVGQSLKMRRYRPVGRGRMHPYRKDFSNLEIIVREAAESEN